MVRSTITEFIQLRNSGDWDACNEFIVNLQDYPKLAEVLHAFILIDQQKYDQAHELITDLNTDSNQPKQIQFGINIVLLHLFWTSKRIKDMEKLFDQTSQLFQELSPNDLHEMIYWHAMYFNLSSKLSNRVGDVDKAEEELKKGIDLFQAAGDSYAIIRSLVNLSVIEKDRGNYDAVFQVLFDAETRLKELDPNYLVYKKLMYSIMGNIANTYLKTKKYDLALKYYNENEKWIHDVGSDADYCILLINKGAAANAMEDYDLSLQFLEEATALATKIDNQFLLAYCYRNLADIDYIQKNFQAALEKFETSLTIARKQDLKIVIASNLSNIGLIKAQQGELHEASRMYSEVIEMIDQQSGIYDPEFLDASFHSMGTIFARQGEYGRAHEFWEKRLALTKQIGDPREISTAIFSIFLLSLDQNRSNEAASYLTELRKISLEHHNTGIQRVLRLATAVYMKYSTEDDDSVQHILEDLVYEDLELTRIFGLNYQILAMYNLCEIYINKFSKTGVSVFVNKAEELVQKMTLLAEDQGLLIVKGETLILRSKINILQLQMSQARQLLLEAADFAKIHQLRELERDVELEIELIITGQSFSKDQPMTELMEQVQIMKFLRTKGGSRGSLPRF